MKHMICIEGKGDTQEGEGDTQTHVMHSVLFFLRLYATEQFNEQRTRVTVLF